MTREDAMRMKDLVNDLRDTEVLSPLLPSFPGLLILSKLRDTITHEPPYIAAASVGEMRDSRG